MYVSTMIKAADRYEHTPGRDFAADDRAAAAFSPLAFAGVRRFLVREWVALDLVAETLGDEHDSERPTDRAVWIALRASLAHLIAAGRLVRP